MLCAIANLLIGAGLYGVLYKVLLADRDDDSKAADRVPMSSSYAPAVMADDM